MQIGLQLQLQTVLVSHINLIEDASFRPVGDQFFLLLSSVH
jgi:hypothetical protein